MMNTPSVLHRAVRTLRRSRFKGVAVVAFLVLVIIAGVALRRTFDPARAAPPDPASLEDPQSTRSHTSKGTLFEDVWSVEELNDILERHVSAIVDERIKLLSSPSTWVCETTLSASSTTPLPELQKLANELPGWSYEYGIPFLSILVPVRIPKPVTFENFSSILLEFMREYEARISELEAKTVDAIKSNLDLKGTDAKFCCTAQEACAFVREGMSCAGTPSADPDCGKACGKIIDNAELAIRQSLYTHALETSKLRTRVAVQRTMLTLRSSEQNYTYAQGLMCYARASLDLRQVLNLLAEGTSCLPKIWDAVTSLHDRKQ